MAIETRTQEAADIYNVCSEAIDTFKATAGFYPDIDNVATEAQGTLPLDEKVTLADIEEASAFLTFSYPNIMGVNASTEETYHAFIEALKLTLNDRIVQEKPSEIRSYIGDFAIIFSIITLAYVLISKRER